MANSFNPLQDVQYSASQFGQQKLSVRDKLLIETLLVDSGVFDFAVAAPTPTPGPIAAPSPTPTPAPAPTPTPAQAQAAGATVNLFVQLALNKIRPGDLITAQFGNDLVDAVLALDARLRALEGVGRATATPTPTPTPTPATPTPSPATPTPSASGSLTGLGKSQPTIDAVTATTVRGKGVTIEVSGDNLGESQVERVLLGATQIAPSSLKFVRGGGGFSFLTTTAIVGKAKNRLTVVTSGGEDSAALTSETRKAPVL